MKHSHTKFCLFLSVVGYLFIISASCPLIAGIGFQRCSGQSTSNISLENFQEKKAVSAYLAGDTVAAEKWCSKLDSIDIRNKTAFLIRIMLVEDLGGREQSRVLYEEMFAQMPNQMPHQKSVSGSSKSSEDTWNIGIQKWAAGRLGKILVEDGNLEKAKSFIDYSLSGNNVYSDSWIARACYLEAENDFRNAIKAIEKAKDIGASRLLCEIRKFNYYLHLEEFGEANDCLKKMRRLSPYLPVTGFLKGRLLFLSSRYNKALKFFKGYCSSPQSTESLVVDALEIIAIIHERQGQLQQAIKALEKAEVISANLDDGGRCHSIKQRILVLSDKIQVKNGGRYIQKDLYKIKCRADIESNLLEEIVDSLNIAMRKIRKFYSHLIKSEIPVTVLVLKSMSNDLPAFYDRFNNEIVIGEHAFKFGQHIIEHELSHLFFAAISGRKAFKKSNLWAIEGIAEYHSSSQLPFQHGFNKNLYYDFKIASAEKLYSIQQLANLLSVERAYCGKERKLAYLQAQLMVCFVSQKWKSESLSLLIDFTKTVGKGTTVNKSFVQHFGVNKFKFMEMYNSFVRAYINKWENVAIRLQ